LVGIAIWEIAHVGRSWRNFVDSGDVDLSFAGIPYDIGDHKIFVGVAGVDFREGGIHEISASTCWLSDQLTDGYGYFYITAGWGVWSVDHVGY